MPLLALTLWIFITLVAVHIAYNAGKKAPKNKEFTKEEKRILEKERRELENFWTYNGDEQSR